MERDKAAEGRKMDDNGEMDHFLPRCFHRSIAPMMKRAQHSGRAPVIATDTRRSACVPNQCTNIVDSLFSSAKIVHVKRINTHGRLLEKNKTKNTKALLLK